MKHLFLDLEKTWIESVDNPIFLQNNIKMIKSLFIREKFETIVIFSFAIHEMKDAIPLEFIFCHIEETLGLKPIVVPKNCLLPEFRKFFNIPTMDLIDFHDFCNNKELAFQIHMKECFKNNPDVKGDLAVLVDDMVDNTTLFFNGNTIQTINVESL